MIKIVAVLEVNMDERPPTLALANDLNTLNCFVWRNITTRKPNKIPDSNLELP